ncbi:MAG: WYL domain-containing protein [Erysipelotrichales bacterium]|nr:WYL domain-containing protein [Erysipelotrichales bacterium]
MSKLSNTITMLELLSTGKKYNVNELAEILEVTPRMVRSYKEDLEKAGIYIDSLRGPYGGYVLNQNIKLPRRKFKKDDFEFLTNLNVPQNEQKRLLEIADKVRGIYFGSESETAELNSSTKNYYNILVRAIKERRKVYLRYYSYNKGENGRIIHPFDMFNTSSGWGVSAYCELRNDLRHFELKRINEIKLLDDFFE